MHEARCRFESGGVGIQRQKVRYAALIVFKNLQQFRVNLQMKVSDLIKHLQEIPEDVEIEGMTHMDTEYPEEIKGIQLCEIDADTGEYIHEDHEAEQIKSVAVLVVGHYGPDKLDIDFKNPDQ